MPGNEDKIMQEIYKNGPVALNFLAISDTYRYKKGIYVPSVNKDFMEIELE